MYSNRYNKSTTIVTLPIFIVFIKNKTNDSYNDVSIVLLLLCVMYFLYIYNRIKNINRHSNTQYGHNVFIRQSYAQVVI